MEKYKIAAFETYGREPVLRRMGETGAQPAVLVVSAFYNQQMISRAEVKQYLVNIFFGDGMVCAGIYKNGVVSLLIHLNDRMTCSCFYYVQIFCVYACFPQCRAEQLAVLAYAAAKKAVRAGSLQCDRLIQALSPGESPAIPGQLRLTKLNNAVQ